MASTTIRKLVITEFSSSVDVLQIVSDELPVPLNDEVQVEILYAGFAGSDINMRRGWYPMQKKAPLTPGYCFVGRVRRNGPKASTFQPGDMVAACTMYDSDAEGINIPEKYLNAVPAGLDIRNACAMVMDWNTAYGMVFNTAKVSKGQRVFVHGLSGAVGYAIMSLCKLQGATVYGTASARNHAALRELGVEPFTYTNKDWIAAMKDMGGVHAVFDPLGYDSFDESFSILHDKERCILVGYGQNKETLKNNEEPSGSALAATAKMLAKGSLPFCNKSTSFYYITRDQKTFKPSLEALFQLSLEKKVDVSIKHVFEFDDIKEAHSSWGKVEGIGSVLIHIGN